MEDFDLPITQRKQKTFRPPSCRNTKKPHSRDVDKDRVTFGMTSSRSMEVSDAVDYSEYLHQLAMDNWDELMEISAGEDAQYLYHEEKKLWTTSIYDSDSDWY